MPKSQLIEFMDNAIKVLHEGVKFFDKMIFHNAKISMADGNFDAFEMRASIAFWQCHRQKAILARCLA